MTVVLEVAVILLVLANVAIRVWANFFRNRR